MVVSPPTPQAPLQSDVWGRIPSPAPSLTHSEAWAPQIARKPLQGVAIKGEICPEECSLSSCSWTDGHINTCSKVQVLAKCGQETCVWGDKHRTDNVVDRHRNVVFSCPKLQFYCNIKKTGPGKYEKMDKFTPSIATQCKGPRDETVQESRRTSMRLLYRQTNRLVADPRLTTAQETGCYPKPRPLATALVLRGSGQAAGWTLVSYSALSQVKVTGFNSNPHLVEEDEEDEIECVDQIDGDVVEVPDEPDGSPLSDDSKRRRRQGRKGKGAS